MITIENLQINNYNLNLHINDHERIGVFSVDKNITNELLLILAGIMRSKGKCLYNDDSLYDNDKYFKNRIYLDCRHEYLNTLDVQSIYQAVRNKFQKNINLNLFKRHIDALKIRGECDITFSLSYKFTPTGNTLINLCLAFSLSDNLIINNPTINISRLSDLEYLRNQFDKRNGFVILGVNSLLHMKNYFDRIILFTDYDRVEVINSNDNIYVIDYCDIIDDYKLYKASGQRIIIKEIPQETLKRFAKQKIKVERINVYELEKYLP